MKFVPKNEQMFYLAVAAAIIASSMVILTGQRGTQHETAKASSQDAMIQEQMNHSEDMME